MDLRGHGRLPARLELSVRASHCFPGARTGCPDYQRGRDQLGTAATCSEHRSRAFAATCSEHRPCGS
eukprot:5867022-Pleurochrysis_carterae.AAC.1